MSTVEQPWAEKTKAEKVAAFTEAVEFITDPEWLPWFEYHHPETVATLREIARRVVEQYDREQATPKVDEPATEPARASGRYQPSAEEQAAIDLLTASGHKVVRAKTYENLQQKVRDAEWQVRIAQQDAESARHWARTSLAGERRMTDRLNAVCFAAAALGVPIGDINAALGVPIGDINAALDKARAVTDQEA